MADTQDEVAIKSVEVEKPTISCERKHKFVFNKCCFCVPLRTGCLILAYLFMVGRILYGMYYLWILANRIYVVIRFPEFSHDTVVITVLVLNSVKLGLALIAIPFNVLLLIGLHKEKRSFVRLFVRFQWVYIILNVLQYIIFVIVMRNIETVGIGIWFLVSQGFIIYCTLVMRSQYLKMGAPVSSEPVALYKDGHLVMTP